MHFPPIRERTVDGNNSNFSCTRMIWSTFITGHLYSAWLEQTFEQSFCKQSSETIRLRMIIAYSHNVLRAKRSPIQNFNGSKLSISWQPKNARASNAEYASTYRAELYNGNNLQPVLPLGLDWVCFPISTKFGFSQKSCPNKVFSECFLTLEMVELCTSISRIWCVIVGCALGMLHLSFCLWQTYSFDCLKHWCTPYYYLYFSCVPYTNGL